MKRKDLKVGERYEWRTSSYSPSHVVTVLDTRPVYRYFDRKTEVWVEAFGEDITRWNSHEAANHVLVKHERNGNTSAVNLRNIVGTESDLLARQEQERVNRDAREAHRAAQEAEHGAAATALLDLLVKHGLVSDADYTRKRAYESLYRGGSVAVNLTLTKAAELGLPN